MALRKGAVRCLCVFFMPPRFKRRTAISAGANLMCDTFIKIFIALREEEEEKNLLKSNVSDFITPFVCKIFSRPTYQDSRINKQIGGS